MKTYTGELIDGMPCEHKSEGQIKWDKALYAASSVQQVYHDNEWQLYKPQAKKVWGIPEEAKLYKTIPQQCHHTGNFKVNEWKNNNCEIVNPMFLSREHAEQHAKALNMANGFRLLSDVPVDDVRQWFSDSYGRLDYSKDFKFKLQHSLFLELSLVMDDQVN